MTLPKQILLFVLFLPILLLQAQHQSNPLTNLSLLSQDSCEALADKYFERGSIAYDEYDLIKTLAYWRDSALVLYNNCSGDRAYEKARTVFMIGVALDELENLKAAIDSFQLAIKYFEAIPDLALDNLAYRYLETAKRQNKIGDYNSALLYLNQAQKNYSNAKEISDEVELIDLNIEYGLTYLNTKKLSDAIFYFKKAISKSFELKDNTYLTYCYQDIARAYLELQEYEEANYYLSLATKENQKKGDFLELSKNYNLLGILKKREGNIRDALDIFEQSIDYVEKAYSNPYNTDRAAAYENAADVLLLQKKTGKALEYYQKSISSLVPDFKSTTFADHPIIDKSIVKNRNYLQRVLDLKAQALEQYAEERGEVKWQQAAFQCYLAIDTLSNQIRQSFQAAGSRYYFQEKIVPIYERAIALALRLYGQTQDEQYLHKAYGFCAKNKALVLLDGLQNEEAKFSANLPDSLLRRENKLKKQYAQLEAQIYDLEGTDESKQLEELRSQLFQTRRAYEKLIDRFEQEFPAYYELKYAFSAPIELKELQEQLPEKTLVLEYFVGEHHIYTFAIGKDAIRYYSIKRPSNFKETCIQFRESTQLSKLDFQETYLQAGYQLYQWLLQAALNEVELTGDLNRLFIIPDDLLLQISFDALLYEPIDQWQGKKNPYLLKKYTISLAYANRLLFDDLKRERIQANVDGFIGFGIEYDEFTLEGVSKLGNSPDSLIQQRAVGKLPYSDDEVLEIAELIGGIPLVNEEATKEVFLGQAQQHSIVHLAMHGIVNEEAPLQSGFIFTRTRDSIDYILRAADIYNMKLAADMAVLSACNTGYGRLEKGEGMRSLARAFSYAGCHSLVASLWEAPDNASKEILVEFYRNLKEGQTKDVALRNAKLNYIQNTPKAYADPAFWAHLVTLGDVEALDLNPTSFSYVWMLAVLLFAVLGFMSFKRLRRA